LIMRWDWVGAGWLIGLDLDLFLDDLHSNGG